MGRNSIVEFSRHGTARHSSARWRHARVCAYVHGCAFRIIIIHQLVNVADNIADVSRMPIRFRQKDESRDDAKALASFNAKNYNIYLYLIVLVIYIYE